MLEPPPIAASPLGDIDLHAVRESLLPYLNHSALLTSDRINQVVGHSVQVILQSEVFQHTGSFKFRAAMAVALGSQAPRLLTASSGNFGAALALAARRTGKGLKVVMPQSSSPMKIEAVRRYGAEVDLIDTQVVSRRDRVAELSNADPEAQVVSPYDDRHVIAGNSSLAAELFGQHVPDCIIAPVGGGGLSAGTILARDLFAPSCLVVGAEPRLGNDAARSLRAGSLCANEREPDTICDGARTVSLGELNFAILKKGMAHIIEVEEAEVARAMRLIFETVHLVVEPTGALALAALIAAGERFSGQRVCCILSGGNVDAEVYARLITR